MRRKEVTLLSIREPYPRPLMVAFVSNINITGIPMTTSTSGFFLSFLEYLCVFLLVKATAKRQHRLYEGGLFVAPPRAMPWKLPRPPDHPAPSRRPHGNQKAAPAASGKQEQPRCGVAPITPPCKGASALALATKKPALAHLGLALFSIPCLASVN